MTGQCCVGGRASRQLARPLSRAAASILPGAVLVCLPKCPLCLAAWLTVVTGVGFSAAGAAWVPRLLVVFWVAAVAPPRRRSFGVAPSGVRRPSSSTVLKCPQSGWRNGAPAYSPWAPYRHPTALSTEVPRSIPSGSSANSKLGIADERCQSNFLFASFGRNRIRRA
jgi:hypothetical protein